MAKNTKGITIEIDGDTTGLTQALKKVDNETKNVQNELKQVDRLLKFDPSNVELLTQKQKLLGDAIDSTSKRLDTLKQAQGEVERQFKNGEIGEEAYRKFQREIIATEGKLKAFQKQANATDIKIEAKADTSAIDKMKNSLKELGPAAKQAASEIGSALGNAGAAAAAGVGALVVGSTDLNNDLARLRTNAQIAGRDLGLVEDAFKQITAVTGETDSAVETVSNLLASGFKDNQLQAVIEGINGAAIKFSDTLKTEGIADGIQETFATGEAIGMFAELLEREGVNLDEFNEKLAVAKKNGTEADLVMQTMANLGLTQVSEKYKELNTDLVANNEATVSMQKALADLAIVLTPLVTMVAELVTKFVEWATANPQLSTTLATIAGVIGSIAGAFALLGPVISSISSLWGVLSGAVTAIIGPLASAGGAATTLGTVFSFLTGPIGIAIAAITAIVGALVVAYNKIEWFRDGVNEIWNLIKDYTSQAFGAVKDLVTSLIGDAVDFGKELLDKFADFWEENGKFIMETVKTYFGIIKDNIKTTMEFIQDIFEVVWPIISDVIKVSWEYIQLTIGSAIDLILGIIQLGMKVMQGDWEGAWETIKGTAEDIVGNMMKFFEDVDLMQVGKDMIQGLINGIGSMKDFVLDVIEDTVGSAVKFAKQILGIKSPSRVFKQIGEWTGEGLAIGLRDQVSNVKGATGELAYALIDTMEGQFDEIKKLEKEQAEALVKIENEKAKKIKDAQTKNAKSKGNTTVSQLSKIAALEEAAAKKSLEIEKKYGEKIAKEREKIDKAKLDTIKNFIDNKKSLEQLSLVEEANLWKNSISAFSEGSTERIKAQQEYKKAYDTVQKEITSINDKYSQEMKRIDSEYLAEVKRVTEEQQTAFENRKNSLMSFAATFDEFNLVLDKSGSVLTENLQNQVNALALWRGEFDKISQRGISEGLLSEISSLGVNALPELVALNKMTDEELTKYSGLYEEKARLAKEQTAEEMEQIVADNTKYLEELRSGTDTELEKLKVEWDRDIKAITGNTKTELSGLYQIGVDAGAGLLNGLDSMSGALIAKASEIANAISSTIQSALDINSPSRVMRGFGINIGQGLIVGMDTMINKVAQSSTRLSEAVGGAFDSLANSGAKSQAYGVSSTTTTSTVDNRKTFAPVIHNYGSDTDTRAQERMLKRLAIQFN